MASCQGVPFLRPLGYAAPAQTLGGLVPANSQRLTFQTGQHVKHNSCLSISCAASVARPVHALFPGKGSSSQGLAFLLQLHCPWLDCASPQDLAPAFPLGPCVQGAIHGAGQKCELLEATRPCFDAGNLGSMVMTESGPVSPCRSELIPANVAASVSIRPSLISPCTRARQSVGSTQNRTRCHARIAPREASVNAVPVWNAGHNMTT